MRITIVTLSGTLLGMSVPLIAADDALSELREGDRIRLSTPALDEQRSVAGLVGIEGDTLIVRLPDRQEPTRIPLSEVGKLEVARGTKSRMGRGALIGGLAGMLLGGGAVAAHLGGGGELGESSAVALVAGGLAAGSLLEGVVGLTIKTDHWVNVSVGGLDVGLALLPGRSRGLALSLGF